MNELPEEDLGSNFSTRFVVVAKTIKYRQGQLSRTAESQKRNQKGCISSGTLHFEELLAPLFLFVVLTPRPVEELRLKDACQGHRLHVLEKAVPQLELTVDG